MLTPRAMKAHNQKSYKGDKRDGRKCVQGCKWSTDAQVHLFFLECSSMLNATPVTNAFLNCT